LARHCHSPYDIQQSDLEPVISGSDKLPEITTDGVERGRVVEDRVGEGRVEVRDQDEETFGTEKEEEAEREKDIFSSSSCAMYRKMCVLTKDDKQ
jgi:hypothetical protein